MAITASHDLATSFSTAEVPISFTHRAIQRIISPFSSISHRQDALLDVLLSLGVPAEKLVMTVPSYGYMYQLQQAHITSPGSSALPGVDRLSRKEVRTLLVSSDEHLVQGYSLCVG